MEALKNAVACPRLASKWQSQNSSLGCSDFYSLSFHHTALSFPFVKKESNLYQNTGKSSRAYIFSGGKKANYQFNNLFPTLLRFN